MFGGDRLEVRLCNGVGGFFIEGGSWIYSVV